MRGNREASKKSTGDYMTIIKAREYEEDKLDYINVSQQNKCV